MINRLLTLVIVTTALSLPASTFAQDSDPQGDYDNTPDQMAIENAYNDPSRAKDVMPQNSTPVCSDPQGCTDNSVAQMKKELGESESACLDTAKTTGLACNTLGSDGMDPSQGMMMEMMMNQLVTQTAAIASVGKNQSAQCKLQGDIAKTMGVLNGLKTAACGAMMAKCSSSCSAEIEQYGDYLKVSCSKAPMAADCPEVKKKLTAATSKRNICKSYVVNVMGMLGQSLMHGMNYAQNKQCQEQLASNVTPPTAPPTAPPIDMIGDCSDTRNQSYTCFCQRAENKETAMCKSGSSQYAGGGSVQPTGPGGGNLGSFYTPTVDGETGELDPSANLPGKGGSGGDRSPSDGGSGAGGGSGLASMGGGDGGPGSADGKSAITGVSNSAGGLGSGGGGGGGGLARNNGGAGKEGSFVDKFNLKKFLPGSKFKNRGIAGMSVKSVDGITGPMGPSLWEKATRQYQEQIQKQNVILDK